MSHLKAYLLCRFADHSSVFTSWMDQAPLQTVVIDEYLPDWQIPDDAGILITHMHYRWEELTTLRRALQQDRVPILILADGILEYRNTWEHPDLVDGSIFQPLFGHKLACIGRAQARVVESWGNVGRCEVVGLPSLDQIDVDSIPEVNCSGVFRVLVATANTPSFDQQQRDTVVQSLRQLKNWLAENPSVGGRPLEFVWRLSDGLESELGVGDDQDQEDRPPIGTVIENVDAVITTPSTLYLESVLRRRPTALLDFHNSPQYVNAAWTINAPHQVGTAISELASPPPHKMMFQEFVLRDQLECQTPATPRMLELIKSMVDAGSQARTTGNPVELMPRILEDEQQGFTRVPERFDASTLYPDNGVFQTLDRRRLEIELAAAVKRLEQLPYELADKNQYIAKLMRSLERSRERVEDMHNRIVAIRKRVGIDPPGPAVDSARIEDDQ